MDIILIIDSSQTTSLLISRFLESAGYSTHISSEGQEALKIAKVLHPSLIICNTTLSGMNAYEVLLKLTEDDHTASIPFIFLSSNDDHEELRRGMELGADSFIMSPFNAAAVTNIIKTKLKKLRLTKKQGLQEYIRENTDSGSIKCNDTILLNVDKRKKLINKSDIEYITAFGPYTNLFVVGKGMIRVRKLLKVWECILPQESFIKIHRSAIINSHYIKEIERCSSRSLLIKMENSNKNFIASQRFSPRIRARFQMR